ncbi:hypothetical protein NEHOM01_1832 [Nematocida homosporus]|uniref:uncharacterized protein n=1 Tax=Nematocida homosporus TaxID=1912981 RepID=UPI00221F6A4C|nr:uncharacterized protein NEHOM01_1832 [Nematocida homosporus]KAI5186974.1 hypothetical protein NEHOM01_1832 [Nematocida homosporus]
MEPDHSNHPRSRKTKEHCLPAYLKWRHLVSSVGDRRLPIFLSFLLRVITLTDSVISFNNSKRITNTLSAICKTVSHLSKTKVNPTHYKQILWIFGDVYKYKPSCIQPSNELIIEQVPLENRFMTCEKRALDWARKEYTGEDLSSLADPLADPAKLQAIDELILADKTFRQHQAPNELGSLLPGTPPLQAITLSESAPNPPPPNSSTIPSTLSTSSISSTHPPCPTQPNPRALSILDRIKQREQARKDEFIRMEQAKDTEIRKAFHTIYLLALSENKRSFEKSVLEKRIPLFRQGSISLDDVITHPDHQKHIKHKQFDNQTFLVFDFDKYHQNSQP